MPKLHVQKAPPVWSTSASLASSGSSTSGSFICPGYARITGIIISSASSESGSGLRISQSPNFGDNYDYHTDYQISACSGSAFSIEIVGNCVKVDYKTDSAADVFRTLWQLRPI